MTPIKATPDHESMQRAIKKLQRQLRIEIENLFQQGRTPPAAGDTVTINVVLTFVHTRIEEEMNHAILWRGVDPRA